MRFKQITKNNCYQKIVLLVMLVALLFITNACNKKTCENYDYTECPGYCELCGDNVWSSRLECHSKEYCETTFECIKYNVSNCPDKCAVCPPCAECSSISCQSEQFCESIGFNKNWYNEIKERQVESNFEKT